MKNILLIISLFIFSTLYAQVQVGNDLNGLESNERFGFDTSITPDGNRIVIGAIGTSNQSGVLQTGSMSVYEIIDNVWTQLGTTIYGEAANNAFGLSVTISADGNRIVGGSPWNYGGGGTLSRSGHIRAYEYNGADWVQLGEDLEGIASADRLGSSVTISADGNRIASGAIQNDTNGSQAGQVRIYDWNSTTELWDLQGIINGDAGDYSGISSYLSDDGNRIIIGANGNSINGADAGRARVYDYDGTNWMQVGNDILGVAAGDECGFSTSISSDGNKIAIASIANDEASEDAGQVRIFSYDGTDWVQLGNSINGEASFDQSGISVDISGDGNVVAIGANLNDNNGANSGHLKMYFLNGNTWQQLENNVVGSAVNTQLGFGVSLTQTGNNVSVGEIQNSETASNSGEVRVYEFDLTPLGNTDIAGSKVQFYPNPVKNKINIKGINSSSYMVNIIDTTGRVLLSQVVVNENAIDISTLSKGVYYLVIFDTHIKSTHSFIKE